MKILEELLGTGLRICFDGEAEADTLSALAVVAAAAVMGFKKMVAKDCVGLRCIRSDMKHKGYHGSDTTV